MITTIPFILAERSQGSGLVFLIFAGIWILFAIINGISKKAEEEKRKRLRAQLEGSVARPPQPFQPQVLRAVPVTKPVARPQSSGRAQSIARQQPAQAGRTAPKRKPVARETKRSAPRTAPPPIPAQKQVVQSIVGSFASSKQDISATEIRNPGDPNAKQAAKLSVNAGSLNRWLRPATLRQQFMLTEVLQSPLALRPDRWNQ